jgi:2-hydroxychromene-2-carboxylate isomerase
MRLSIESSRPRRWSAALGTALAILAGLLVALAEQQRFVPEPTAAAPAPMASPDFEQRLFAALSRPGFLERAMQAATLGREREKSRSWRELLASEPAVLDARGPFTIALGPAAATRSALVFFDYNCPHCRRLDHELARLRAAQPDIRIVALPVAVLRPSSGTAAQTVLAAARLGKGATLHEAVLAQEGEANDAVLRDAAQRAGLDWDELLKLRDSDDVKREMARIASLAQRLGVQGTPASYLSSGEVIGGAAASDRFLAAWAQK